MFIKIFLLIFEGNKRKFIHRLTLMVILIKIATMKHIKSIIVVLSILVFSCSDEPQNSQVCNFTDYRYYYDQRISVGELQDNYVIVGIDIAYTDVEIENFITSIEAFDRTYNYTIHNNGPNQTRDIPLRLNTSRTCEEITALISVLNQYEIVSYTHYAMQTNTCTNFFGQTMGNLCVSAHANHFLVKAQNNNDLSDLYETIAQTNTAYFGTVPSMQSWHRVKATKESNGDALKMANYFYETGLFEIVEIGVGRYAVE